MKRVLLILGFAVFGLAGVQAQDNNMNQDQAKENNYEMKSREVDVDDDGIEVEKKEVEKKEVSSDASGDMDQPSADTRERSRAGKAVNKVGHGAKKAGKGVGRGAGWTWNKAKHNKVTKNAFNQPGDEDYKGNEEASESKAEDASEDAAKGTKNAVKKGAHETKEGVDKAEDKVDEKL